VLWPRRLVTGFSPLRPGFMSESVQVEFVADKLSLEYFGSFSVNIIRGSPYSYHLRDEQ
jgi:hypothetical protein